GADANGAGAARVGWGALATDTMGDGWPLRAGPGRSRAARWSSVADCFCQWRRGEYPQPAARRCAGDLSVRGWDCAAPANRGGAEGAAEAAAHPPRLRELCARGTGRLRPACDLARALLRASLQPVTADAATGGRGADTDEPAAAATVRGAAPR